MCFKGRGVFSICYQNRLYKSYIERFFNLFWSSFFSIRRVFYCNSTANSTLFMTCTTELCVVFEISFSYLKWKVECVMGKLVAKYCCFFNFKMTRTFYQDCIWIRAYVQLHNIDFNIQPLRLPSLVMYGLNCTCNWFYKLIFYVLLYIILIFIIWPGTIYLTIHGIKKNDDVNKLIFYLKLFNKYLYFEYFNEFVLLSCVSLVWSGWLTRMKIQVQCTSL